MWAFDARYHVFETCAHRHLQVDNGLETQHIHCGGSCKDGESLHPCITNLYAKTSKPWLTRGLQTTSPLCPEYELLRLLHIIRNLHHVAWWRVKFMLELRHLFPRKATAQIARNVLRKVAIGSLFEAQKATLLKGFTCWNSVLTPHSTLDTRPRGRTNNYHKKDCGEVSVTPYRICFSFMMHSIPRDLDFEPR